jgi:hypothetical protein
MKSIFFIFLNNNKCPSRELSLNYLPGGKLPKGGEGLKKEEVPQLEAQ